MIEMKTVAASFAALGLLILAACDASAPNLPGSTSPATNHSASVPLEDLLFLTNQRETVGPFGKKRTFCRDVKVSEDYPHLVISLWTLHSFIDFRDGPEECDIGIYGPDSLRSFAQVGERIETEDCVSDIALNEGSVEKLRVFARQDDPQIYFQCTFRIRIAAMGFLGALEIPQSKMFTASDRPQTLYQLALGNEFFAPVMPERFIRFQTQCRVHRDFLTFPSGLKRGSLSEYYSETLCKS